MNKADSKSLSQLSDDELLVRLSSVLRDSRRGESVLVAHIAEVDARRLYAREASPSMHKYCTDVLHLSEAEAYFRITAPLRRFVWKRDGGRCTFRATDGRRCPERHRLELHHDEPYGLGGDRSAGNVRLLCHAHNIYMAEKDYGKEFMDYYRRSADRAREPSPAFTVLG